MWCQTNGRGEVMYPTREQAQALLNCTQKCRQCINDAFCEKWSTLDIGSYFIEFHDALDAKQAELDKTHDLIRRMTKWYMSTEDTSDGIEYSDYTGLLDEANAMLSEKQAQT